MADIEKLRKNLEDRGIQSSYFATAQEAADYLDQQIDGTTVGIGGSMTVKVMGLYPRLSAHNQVIWHWESGGGSHNRGLSDLCQRRSGDRGTDQHRRKLQPDRLLCVRPQESVLCGGDQQDRA